MDFKVQSGVKAEDGGVIETLCFENILSGGFKCESRMKTYRKRMYAWSTEENYLYMSYLKVISSYFQHSTMAKILRLFSRMSKMIKTRTPNQIKSHHQKMIMKYGSLEKAVKCMELQLSYELYESSSLFNQIKQKSEQVNRYLQLQQKEVAKLYEITVKKISEKRSNKIKIQQGIEGDDFNSLSSEVIKMVALPERVKIEEDLGYIYKFSQIAPEKEEGDMVCKVEMQ